MISLPSSLAASALLLLNVATASIQAAQHGPVVEVSVINTIVASPENEVSKKLDLRAEPTITIADADAPAIYMGKTLSSNGPGATIEPISAVVGYGSDGIVVQYPGGIVSTVKVVVAALSVQTQGDSGVIASAIDEIANGQATNLVPSSTSTTTSSAAASSSSSSSSAETCIEGTGEGNFEGLCSYSCHYGYCPEAVCSCISYGEAVEAPATTGLDGEPAPGEGAGYIGLCSFACSRGYCPEGACVSKASGGSSSNATSSVVPSSTTSSASSPSSSSSTCIEGTGEGNFEGLCSFTCHYGYCPSSVCSCTSYGEKVPAPPTSNPNGVPIPGAGAGYLGLCSFACDHGYCPDTACTTRGGSSNSSSSSSSNSSAFSNGTSTILSTTTSSTSLTLSTTTSTTTSSPSTTGVAPPAVTSSTAGSDASKNVMVWSLCVLAFAAVVVR